MDNSFQTSFIPKKPILSNGSNLSPRSTTSISMVISSFILVIMIASTFGLYLYRVYLEKNKENLSAALFEARNKFDQNTITELESFDKRTSAAKQVLSGHIVLTPLFELMNELTLSSIQYTKFEHSFADNVFSVKMSGIARDYKSIAVQADVFNTSKGSMLKDVIFSNLTKDKNNSVTFDLEFSVDPSLLSYLNNITKIEPNINTNTIDQNISITPVNGGVVTNPTQTILPATSNPQ